MRNHDRKAQTSSEGLEEIFANFFTSLDNRLTSMQENVEAMRRAIVDLRKLQENGFSNLASATRSELDAHGNQINLTRGEVAALKAIVNQHLDEHRNGKWGTL